jgi:hypothetical protein
MAVIRRRTDPGKGFLATAQAIVWVFCFAKGAQLIYAATVILGMELADRVRPVVEFITPLVS